MATAFLLWLPACVNLKPVPSQTKSYTLGPVEAVARTEVGATTETIFILPPQVPTYLDSARLTYRSANGEVKNMLGARWAEPLGEGIARAMSLFLAETAPGMVEGHYPWPNTSPEASRLAIYFQRFGATDSGRVHVVARWEIKRADGGLVQGDYVSESAKWQVGEPDSLVAAYNEALNGLAREIAKRLGPPDL